MYLNWIILNNLASGSNMIVSIVFRLLQNIKEDLGKIPPVLHLSLDNCARENKNRFVSIITIQ